MPEHHDARSLTSTWAERLLRGYSRIAPTERGGYRLARAVRRTRDSARWRDVFRTPDGFDIALDISDYPDACMAYGLYELDTARLIKRLLKPGDHFVDCGANIGYFTMLAAMRVGPGGKVDAFEPQADNFRRLSDNLRRNGLAERVATHELALSDREGTVELFRPSEAIDNHGTSSMFPDPEWRQRGEGSVSTATKTKVQTKRLDEVLRGARPNLIKIDVEGAEPLVASGMSGVVANDPPPSIIMEFNPPKAAIAGFGSTEAIERLLDAQKRYQIFSVGWRLQRLSTDELRQLSQVNVLLQA